MVIKTNLPCTQQQVVCMEGFPTQQWKLLLVSRHLPAFVLVIARHTTKITVPHDPFCRPSIQTLEKWTLKFNNPSKKKKTANENYTFFIFFCPISVSNIFNTFVKKKAKKNCWNINSFTHWQTIHWTTLLLYWATYIIFRHFRVYSTLGNYFTPQTTGLHILKIVLSPALALIPPTGETIWRGRGPWCPFVLMTTVYTENIQKRIGLKHKTEIKVIFIKNKSAVLTYLKLRHIPIPLHQLWRTQVIGKSAE